MSPVMTAYFARVGITNGHDGVHIRTCWHTSFKSHTEMGVSSASNRPEHLKPVCTWMNVSLWSHLFGLVISYNTCGSTLTYKTLPYTSMSTSTSSSLLIIHFGIKNSLSWQKMVISGLYTGTRLVNDHSGRGGGRRAHLISHSGWKCCMSLWRLINSSVQWAVDWDSRLTGDAAASPASL